MSYLSEARLMLISSLFYDSVSWYIQNVLYFAILFLDPVCLTATFYILPAFILVFVYSS